MARRILALAGWLIVGSLALGMLAGSPATAAPEGAPSAQAADGASADGEKPEKAGVVPSAAQAIVPIVATILVFGVVVLFLHQMVWPKILSGLDERARKIREEIEAAEASRAQAKDALEMYEQNLAEAQAETKRMFEQTKAQQAQMAAELRAKADAEVSAMKERALKDIEAAKRAAVSQMYEDAAELASSMASKILRREVSTDDQRALMEESLRELQGSSN